ncbi:MAG: hypothetical protein J7619_23130 [Dyadobacter sp.]|uniref:hypothetical protein n=1 Tax=Dyadobacter sp. TaxID=1914288 RepID=UPI001B26BE90|nr:hypothetical protein [Dyadobacter sp.]MBO9615609.1 hypothetical protein [Dyadobacter sp.]
MPKFPRFEDHNKFLDHLDMLWKLQSRAAELSKNKKFEKEDLRNEFFANLSHLIYNFYVDLQLPFFVNKIHPALADGTLNPYFSKDAKRENDHYSNIFHIGSPDKLKAYHDRYKAQLIFSIWIVFEDMIDVMFEKLATDEEKEIKSNKTFSQISKFLAGLTELTIKKIQGKLHSDFVGLGEKYNLVFKKIENQELSSQIKKFKEFLEFVNTLRNCLHFNSRPLKDRTFELDFGKFEFKKNEFVDFASPEMIESTLEKMMDCVDFLRNHLTLEEKLIHSSKPTPREYEEVKREVAIDEDGFLNPRE